MHGGLEIGVAEVARGRLKGIEEETSFFVVDLAGHGHAHDLHDGDLDRIGILKDWEINGGGAARLPGVDADALLVPLPVKETELVAAQSGRTALRAVDFDVLTTIGIRRHELSLVLGNRALVVGRWSLATPSFVVRC